MRENMLESLPIGILILNEAGIPVLKNSYAQQIFRQLLKHYPESALSSKAKFPQPVWRIWQAVRESRDLFPEQPIIIEDTVPLHPSHSQPVRSSAQIVIYMRARWLELETEAYILIMLEAQ